ncbi:hypothetical protein [Virgibacillus kimchii]
MSNKNTILLFVFFTVSIAGLLDLKYKGLFYRLLPESMQNYVGKQLK